MGLFYPGIRGASGAFSPLDLSPSIGFDNTGIVSSSNLVSQWTDLTGNGRHATQGTGANQPVDNAVTQNSLVMITADGASDFLNVDLDFFLNTNYEFFIVGKRTTDGAGDLDWFLGGQTATTTANQNLYFGYNGATSLSHFQAADGYGATETSQDTVKIYNFNHHDTEGKSINVNGTSHATDAGDTDDMVGSFAEYLFRMRTDYMAGSMGELWGFNKKLSASERTQMVNYLNSKWAVY